jgi:hypothetical protein
MTTHDSSMEKCDWEGADAGSTQRETRPLCGVTILSEIDLEQATGGWMGRGPLWGSIPIAEA